MPYLKNCWYLAAWADEVPPGTKLARIILGTPVVIFREQAGKVNAILDRCPHRFVPLSKGHLKGETIQCIYHGLAFDGTGACVANPHGPILSTMRIAAYPVIEAFHGLWIWMGDPDLIDEAQLPELGFVNDVPKTAFSKGYLHAHGNYQLFVDNILDLTHVDYLHPETLGGGAISRTRAVVSEHDGRLKAAWHGRNETPSPVAKSFMGTAGSVDFEQTVEWAAPAILVLRNITVPAGAPLEAGREFKNLHIMTPETETSTHYFFAATRDYALDDAELNTRLAATRYEIFSAEDKPVIEAQQAQMNNKNFWELKPLLLKTDEGAIRVRRKLEELIAAETAGPAL